MKRKTAGIIAAALTVIMAASCGAQPAQTNQANQTTTTVQTNQTAENTEAAQTTEAARETTASASPADTAPADAPETSGNPVEFSKSSGTYADAFSLELSLEDADKIYYTTDGSDPVTSATRIEYTAPLEIKDRSGEPNVVSAVDPQLFDNANVEISSDKKGFENTMSAPSASAVDKCTVVRATALKSDGSYATVSTGTYFVGDMSEHIDGITESCEAWGGKLSVISITMEYSDLFDSKDGIYVKGDIFEEALSDYLVSGDRLIPDTARRLDANYTQRGREWERTAHIDCFESDGATTELVLSQDCGIRVQGNYSRSDLQKGFRLYAREDYGEKNFKYAFFGEELKNDSGETMDKFKTLTLRAGGNCAFLSKYNDIYWQTLMSELDCETQTGRPCVVYLDGEYWGLYILEEDYSDNYFEDTHGVNNKDVVVYKGDAETYDIGYKLDEGELPEGEKESYYFNDLLSFFKTHKSCESEEDYNALAALVDVESVRDYFAGEVWINNKWDWPGKNWSMWKTISVDPSNPYADGKWRFCFYDVEFGGISGADDARTNTVKEDNYKPNGLLDMGTDNPAVLCYAYLMTNEGFRTDFNATLTAMADTTFEKTNALAVLDRYKNTFEPLYDQFFARYPESGETEECISGGYGSYQCLVDFLEKRASKIATITKYIDKICG